MATSRHLHMHNVLLKTDFIKSWLFVCRTLHTSLSIHSRNVSPSSLSDNASKNILTVDDFVVGRTKKTTSQVIEQDKHDSSVKLSPSDLENLKRYLETAEKYEQHKNKIDGQVGAPLDASKIFEQMETRRSYGRVDVKQVLQKMRHPHSITAGLKKVLFEKYFHHKDYHNLHCYLRTCVHAKMTANAHNHLYLVLQRYLSDMKSTHRNVALILMPDELSLSLVAEGWAQEGNAQKVIDVMSLATQLHYKPIKHLYFCLLSALGQQKPLNTSLVKSAVSDTEKVFPIHDVLDSESLFPTDLKSFCLSAIRRVYSNFQHGRPFESLPSPKSLNEWTFPEKTSHLVASLPRDELKKYIKEQIHNENELFLSVSSVSPSQLSRSTKINVEKTCTTIAALWQTKFKKAFKKLITSVRNISDISLDEIEVYPYLLLMPTSEYVKELVLTCQMICQSYKADFLPSAYYVYSELGRRLNQRHHCYVRSSSEFTESFLNIHTDYSCSLTKGDFNFSQDNHRRMWTHFEHKNDTHSNCLHKDFYLWPDSVLMTIGKVLFREIIMKHAKIPTSMLGSTTKKNKQKSHSHIQAFYFVNRFEMAKRIIKIYPHQFIVDCFSERNSEKVIFSTSDLPTVCPPLPWITHKRGGYLLSDRDFIRWHNARKEQMAVVSEKSEKFRLFTSSLHPVLDSIDILGGCPWRVNKIVLECALKIFQSGVGNMSIDIPISPHEYSKDNSTSKANNKSIPWNVLKTMKAAVKKKESEMYSLWCTQLYRLSIANHLKDRLFWFPHNVDFRGRAYPVPNIFHYMEGDLSRGLLLFGVGKPLGPNGLDWLKVHLVNLGGYKKRGSTFDRLEFANEHLNDIFDSADRPLTGLRWWQKADDPWQTLACCIEITQAIRSGNPAEYICHFPIHQDGSCNGLQHYAALGRDDIGAKAVNLFPYDKPRDVYSEVVKLVELKRKNDATNGLPIARLLEGFIKRKVIKQTVMTTVYGVTPFGARGQISGRLEEMEEFPQKEVMKASTYLAKETFAALNEMFVATKMIQNWLTLCARLISSIGNQPVAWTTPLGFPVIQPYFQYDKFRNRIKTKETSSSNTTIRVVHGNKQKNALPPNFIHSLDSTHMMLTALKCGRSVLSSYVDNSPRNPATTTNEYNHSLKSNKSSNEYSFNSQGDNVTADTSNVDNDSSTSEVSHGGYSFNDDKNMLTVIKRDLLHKPRNPITFISVHDSYWTHACDIPVLSINCRDQFVELHAQPILEKLSLSLQEKFGFSEEEIATVKPSMLPYMQLLNAVLAQVPPRGTFDLGKVLESEYFFS